MRRFYRGIWLVVGTLFVLTTLVVWRGDHSPVEIVGYTPKTGSDSVSSRAVFDLTFSKAIQPPSFEAGFSVHPSSSDTTPVAGSFSWHADHKGVRWQSTQPLAARTAYTVIATGGQTSEGRQLTPFSWTFRTRGQRLVYLSSESTTQPSLANVWSVDADGSQKLQLTRESTGVDSFAISPDGNTIVYASPDPTPPTAGRTPNASTLESVHAEHLWLIDSDGTNRRQLTTEPNVIANNPRWSPAGDVIGYERRVLTPDPSTPGRLTDAPPKLYMIRSNGTTLAPLYAGAANIGFDLVWSPDGTRAAFYDSSRGAVALYDFTPDLRWLVTAIGVTGTWSPDGTRFAYQFLDPQTTAGNVTHQSAYIAAVDQTNQSGEIAGRPLFGSDPAGQAYDESDMAWSPDGHMIVVVRHPLDNSGAYHVWVAPGDSAALSADAAAASPIPTPLTTDDAYSESAPAWSLDSRQLVFSRLPVGGAASAPQNGASGTASQLWTVNADGTQLHELVANGDHAQWLP